MQTEAKCCNETIQQQKTGHQSKDSSQNEDVNFFMHTNDMLTNANESTSKHNKSPPSSS